MIPHVFSQRSRATETRSFSESDWCRMLFCFWIDQGCFSLDLWGLKAPEHRMIVVVLCLGSGCLLHPKNSRVHLFLGDFFETKPVNGRSDVAEERQDPTLEKLMQCSPRFHPTGRGSRSAERGGNGTWPEKKLTLEFSASDLNDHVPFIIWWVSNRKGLL